MGERVVELYSDKDLTRLKKRITHWRTALLILAAAAFFACVVMISLTRTENAARMETAVIAVSTAAGWIVIYGQVFVVTACRRELKHAEMLRSDARKTLAGRISVTDERVKIKSSITARRVEICDNGETSRVLVCETRARELSEATTSAIYTVHGFIAAYEVTP